MNPRSESAIERSQQAWDRLPAEGDRELASGWKVARAPTMTTRQRAHLFHGERRLLAVVWADRWEDAWDAIMKDPGETPVVPEDCRAPGYSWLG